MVPYPRPRCFWDIKPHTWWLFFISKHFIWTFIFKIVCPWDTSLFATISEWVMHIFCEQRIIILAYRIRKSEVFTWDRNSYLTHVISPMGRINKENFHVNSVCIGCIGRHVTLSLGWRHCDVKLIKYPTSTLCVVLNATFKIKRSESKGMQDKESNMSVRCG